MVSVVDLGAMYSMVPMKLLVLGKPPAIEKDKKAVVSQAGHAQDAFKRQTGHKAAKHSKPLVVVKLL
jgi:hypothetical protein